LTEQEYRESSRLNASGLKELYRSPAHFKYWLDNPPEPTPAMEFGTAVHMAILQPDKFYKTYMYIDDAQICAEIGGAKPRATSKYKLWKADLMMANPGFKIIDAEDFKRVEDITSAVNAHSLAGPLIRERGEVELSIEWEYPNFATPMKSRLDKLTYSGVIVDIKTCNDARPTAFARDIWNYLYHIQAAVYQQAVASIDGLLAKFVFIAIEKEPPYAVAVYTLDESTMALGVSEVDRLVGEYEYCTALGVWPAYREEMRTIALPSWASATLTEVI